MLENPNEKILESIAEIDNLDNIFPIVYELIESNKEFTNELISVLAVTNESKV